MSTSGELLVVACAVALGGAVGSGVRYAVETWAASRWGHGWPWGTFAVNVIGSLILGGLVGGVLVADLPRWASLLLATGLCGALTTFSSFALQVLELSGTRTPTDGGVVRFSARGVAYAVASVAVGLIAALAVPAAAALLGL